MWTEQNSQYYLFLFFFLVLENQALLRLELPVQSTYIHVHWGTGGYKLCKNIYHCNRSTKDVI